MTVLDFAPTTRTRDGAVTVQLHDDLWRVTRDDGEVLGYVDRTSTPAGDRYSARRMLTRQRRFIPVGEFWRFADAMDCFRL
jgi:hypothetical protein